jgi:hypothetical protein
MLKMSMLKNYKNSKVRLDWQTKKPMIHIMCYDATCDGGGCYLTYDEYNNWNDICGYQHPGHIGDYKKSWRT